MTDKELIETAKSFTEGLLGEKDHKGMCFVVCLPLQGYLSQCGIESELIEGEVYYVDDTWNHFWLLLPDGRILDPTASQFETYWSELEGLKVTTYLGSKPEWYKVIG